MLKATRFGLHVHICCVYLAKVANRINIEKVVMG